MTYDSMKRGLAVLGLVAVAASAANAQQAGAQQAGDGPKWRGWIGCWAPVAAPQVGVSESSEQQMLVCITPTGNPETVDVSTVANGKVVSYQKLDASGREQPVTAKGCSGTQRASWSTDERRLYLRSATTCDGLRSATSAILSMTATGEWLDVRGVNVYGDENVRVARYRDAGRPSNLPVEVTDALSGVSGTAENARIAAGAPIGATAVIEASRAADSSVVAAWLLERGQPFTLNASTLLELSKAGLPARVSDAMVAVSYPRAFQVARADRAMRDDDLDAYTRRRITAMVDRSFYDPYGWGYSSYLYGPSRYGYGYGLGMNGGYYGGGYYGGGYYAPIVIVREPNGNTSGSRPKVVNGRGYTQNTGSQPSSGGQTSSSPSSSGSSASSSPPPSSSSSGSSSSGSSESSGRTAKPRP
jgi:hypothetical protein